MTIFDVLRYPVPANGTYLEVFPYLPEALAGLFLRHPEFQGVTGNESFDEAYARIDANTVLLRRLILEWEE